MVGDGCKPSFILGRSDGGPVWKSEGLDGRLNDKRKGVTAEKHPELDITGRWKRDEVASLPKLDWIGGSSNSRPIPIPISTTFLQVESLKGLDIVHAQEAKGQAHEFPNSFFSIVFCNAFNLCPRAALCLFVQFWSKHLASWLPVACNISRSSPLPTMQWSLPMEVPSLVLVLKINVGPWDGRDLGQGFFGCLCWIDYAICQHHPAYFRSDCK